MKKEEKINKKRNKLKWFRLKLIKKKKKLLLSNKKKSIEILKLLLIAFDDTCIVGVHSICFFGHYCETLSTFNG